MYLSLSFTFWRAGNVSWIIMSREGANSMSWTLKQKILEELVEWYGVKQGLYTFGQQKFYWGIFQDFPSNVTTFYKN